MLAALRLGVLLTGLLVGACQQSPLPKPAADGDPAGRAALALTARDYADAARLYRQALERDPENVMFHYGLGVALSHLEEERAEAVRALTVVWERGKRGSPEVAAAENWLHAVGALRRPASFPVPSREPPTHAEQAVLEGQAVDGSVGDVHPKERLKLSLIGQPGSPAREARYTVRTDRTGRYRITNVIPGTYQLTDRIAGQPTWRLRVDLKAGETRLLDLTPANSVRVRNDFPDEP